MSNETNSSFPQFVYLPSDAYDIGNDEIIDLTKETSVIQIEFEGLDHFPIFFSRSKALEMLEYLSPLVDTGESIVECNDSIVECDEGRLLQVLESISTLFVTFDPEPAGKGNSIGCSKSEIIESLRSML